MQREILEETGLEIRVLSEKPLMVMPSSYAPVDFGFYPAELIAGDIIPDKSEVEDYGWFSLEQALAIDLMEATRIFYEQGFHIW